MKKFIIILLMLIGGKSYSQQIVMNTQYMLNNFAINPAVAGTRTFAPLILSVRRQWMGIREAPVAQHFSYHTLVAKNIGVGGYVYNDVAGPNRRTGILGAISSQIPTSRRANLSLGIAFSLSQFVFDRDKLITEEPNDNTVANYTTNLLIPDVAAGLKWYGDKFQVGLSGFNLLQTGVDLFDIVTPVTSKLERTILLNGSYLIATSKGSKITFEPAAVMRYMFTAPFQFDVSVRAIYKRMFWVGASYRFKDAVAALIGWSTKRFGVGYSYDFNTSALRGYNSGSHELILTLRTKNKFADRKGSRVFESYDCPSFK